MENDSTRILIETMVRKTLRDIKNSPERSIRNLVDMALHFSEGRFQRNFFALVQSMLQNEDSPYYGLIEDAVAHTDPNRILRFGMNLGYNSCTLGARVIRQTEEREGYNVPWVLSLAFPSACLPQRMNRYQSAIDQGERLGIYTWMLFPDTEPEGSLELMQSHPDSAFFLFCQPEDITPQFLEGAARRENLMLVVKDGEGAAAACKTLRQGHFLYSLFYRYGEAEVSAITGGDVLRRAAEMHPIFTGLIAKPGCPVSARNAVYDYVKAARLSPQSQTVAWEVAMDGGLIDSIISEEVCVAGFDADGDLRTPDAPPRGGGCNLLENSLRDILILAFPKAQRKEAVQ